MKYNFYLFIIIVFSVFIRVYKINTLPPALYYDEVDAGFQAQTFNQNHTDYYGNKFPIHFHSFGDFRTSLQIYSVSLLQSIGINPETSVRLPSAIFGITSVIVIFLITKSVIPSFLLAISPWAIHYSRIGFEVSGMLACLLLGIYFWQKFTQKHKYLYLYFSILSFCLSAYAYSTAKLFLIFVAIAIVLIWRKELIKVGLKKLIFPMLFGLILMLPMALDTVRGNAGYRFSYISIFTLPHREQIVDSERYQDVLTDHPNQLGLKTSIVSKIFHNKYQLVIQRFVSNYINSFSPSFLFLKGDNNPRHGFGDHGLVYVFDFIFVVAGIFKYFCQKTKDPLTSLFFWLLVLSPIPFSLTRDVELPHATRLILMLPSIIYFTYYGLIYIKSKHLKTFFASIFIYLIFFLNFWHYYYYHYPHTSATDWNTGMKQAVIVTNKYQNTPIVFSDSYVSFISFFLFYRPYILPSNSSIQDQFGHISNTTFSGQVLDTNYFFGHINWTNLSNFPPQTIFVVPATEYKSEHLNNFQTITIIEKQYVNQEGFYIIKVNEK